MLILWLQFILCSAVIVLCGTNLARYGDIIAEKTGLGRAWIGLVLMASVTSLPELITGISSVALAGVPDIALGDIMGSCVFNLSIIAIMDIFHGPRPIFSKAEHGHILSAGFGVILIGIASISILSNASIPSIGHVGIYTPSIILIYMLGVRSLFLFERRKIKEFVEEMAEALQYEDVSTKKAVFKYSLNALIIVGAASWLPFIGDRLAEETGLGRSFVGSVFIALTTSLPELAVSISALRIGAADMAIANLFGSNIFNIFILAIDDIFYTKGPILSHVSMSHAITGFMAVVMTGIAVVSLSYRLEKK
ncbi:MAG: sodium:calcium antiporter, partial [Deltaproteobacteria bacterium]